MFSHIGVGSNNMDKAERFYNAILTPLGFEQRIVEPDGGASAVLGWHNPPNALPRFSVYEPIDGRAASAGNGTMVAFEAPSIQAVDEAYAAALKNGGTDEGAAGPRDHYGVGYYGAYLRDPDGNKIHIAFRADLK